MPIISLVDIRLGNFVAKIVERRNCLVRRDQVQIVNRMGETISRFWRASSSYNTACGSKKFLMI